MGMMYCAMPRGVTVGEEDGAILAEGGEVSWTVGEKVGAQDPPLPVRGWPANLNPTEVIVDYTDDCTGYFIGVFIDVFTGVFTV